MTDSPRARYQHDIQQRGFTRDPAQIHAVEQLQNLFEQLQKPRRAPGWLGRLRGPRPAAKGLYLWGGVGRGKTYLMDIFYECLQRPQKRRVHFHRFMQDVHQRLRQHGGRANPLEAVSEELLEQATVLCFDEFFVVDIADAMILGGLLQHLFEGGMVLVATSNIEPDGLYRDGLQRAKFLPAINLLNRHTQVINVDGDTDYRLRILTQAEIYHTPLNSAARARMEAALRQLAPGEISWQKDITINHRPVATIACSDGIVWCSFAELCESPRSSSDYIELSRRFNTLMLSDIPVLEDGMNDPARRFINLIDELYDRNVNLMVSAAASPDQLYRGSKLAFEYQRTLSRLTEMQSQEYLAREHKP